MELNKKRSGILPFADRMAKDVPLMKIAKTYDKKNSQKIMSREWIPTTKEICGIPVVDKYKYLGSYFDPKLTMKSQREAIEKKSNFLFVKLYS